MQIDSSQCDSAMTDTTAKVVTNQRKTFLSSVAVVYWLTIGVAHAQNHVAFSTPSGCAFFLHPFVAAQVKGTQNYKGECDGGVAHGQGYALLNFGSEQAVVFSHWERGLQTGASVYFHRQQPGRLVFADYLRGVQGTAITRDQGWNPSLINTVVREMFDRVGARASLPEAVVTETALRWNQMPRKTRPVDVFAQIDASALQSPMRAARPDGITDEPKARGRSARVM